MKTHKKILEETESQLFGAMIECDTTALQKLMDVDFIYTNETGEVFTGSKNQPIMNPEILCAHTIDIIDRNITFFNNVAIVNSFEKRTGIYLGNNFNGEYRHTRIWKFNARNWQLIGAIAADCKTKIPA